MIKHELAVEVLAKAKEYKTKDYSMSIGELISMHAAGELVIDPDFQRTFRWSAEQKTRLIESIILGIPIPQIFVFQRNDGFWEIVDGLQRISTILQFVGALKGHSKLKLTATKSLPALQDIEWPGDEIDFEKDKSTTKYLPSSTKLGFKRAKIGVIIIYEETGSEVKYEVFQRLNTGGSFASDQEIRNCTMAMFNKDFFQWFTTTSASEEFLATLSLTDRLLDENYNAELFLRFIAYRKFTYNARGDLRDFLDVALDKLMKDATFDREAEAAIFVRTFHLLNAALGENAFKKNIDGIPKGKFLESAFEAVAIGIGKNIDQYNPTTDLDIVRKKVQDLWSQDGFTKYIGSGSNVGIRIPNILPFAETHFRK